MEILDNRSPEVGAFLRSLDEMREVVTVVMRDRTPRFNGEKYLSRDEVCDMIHVSPRTLQEYRDTGQIGYIRIAGKIIYKESDIMKLLEDNYYPPSRDMLP